MTRSAPALLVFLLSVVFAAPATAGMRDEAERQLAFAREELQAEKFDRALASAESALRLEPSLYDAMVVKALAYEGLGNLRMAEVMLLAYGEVATGLGPNPEVEEALVRLQQTIAEDSSTKRRKRAGGPGSAGEGTAEPGDSGLTLEPLAGRGPVEPLDPEPFRERVAQGLSEGKCEYARAAALELTASAPDLAGGYRLLGDAARCDSRTREAVLAYRRFKALGGEDSKVDLMLRGLEADLATLVVAVDSEALDSSVPPQVALHLVTETLAAAPLGDGTVTFSDLPVGKTLVIDVSGKGLATAEVNVEPLEPGEERTLRVSPEWIGLGTVSLVDHDPGLCETILLTPDGDLAVEPGKQRTVTAGQVTAVVANDHGVIEVPLELVADSTLDFDPLPWLPSSLTLIQLPSGSSVRVFVEGIDDALGEAGFDVPIGSGEVDPLTGVRVAPPHKLDSLPGGRAGIFVTHPVLGTGNVSTVQQKAGLAKASLSCLSSHLLLREAVLERLTQQQAGPGFSGHNLLLVATHTHSAPTGLGDSPFYNGRNFGFSPGVFDHVVDGIVQALVEADDRSRPATLRLGRATIPMHAPVAFNRSLEPFGRNAEAQGRQVDAAEAVEREIQVVRIEDEQGRDKGLLSFFGLHLPVLRGGQHAVRPVDAGDVADGLRGAGRRSLLRVGARPGAGGGCAGA